MTVFLIKKSWQKKHWDTIIQGIIFFLASCGRAMTYTDFLWEWRPFRAFNTHRINKTVEVFRYSDFHPIGYGLFQYRVLWGGGVTPPLLKICCEGLRPILFYTVGYRFTKTKNPKNEPASIKTLDLRVKNSFNLRVGNAIFAENRAKIQVNFWAAILKWPPKITSGR